MHTHVTFPEVRMMLFADCPLCAEPAPLDPESGALDCTACAIHLELADDPALSGLAAA